MAKTLKFDLPIGEDMVATLGELRDHFSLGEARTEIIEHFHSGKLAKWLLARSLITELEKVKTLTEKVEELPDKMDADAAAFRGLVNIFLDSTQDNHPDHPGGMEIFRKGAIHLLNIQIDLLEGMLKEDDVITKKRKSAEQTFTRESVPKDLEVLRGELSKLEKLDLVLAIFGTMKAGKSTAINAIVGTEVLPTRNRPMTALPTLIRHTPGTTKPILRFENRQPVNDHASRLRDKVKKSRHDLQDEMDRDPHFHDLVDSIDKGEDFKGIYKGASEIAEFLKDLNDLVRLSSRFDLEFPFGDYDEVGEMPVIEVEFAHLSEMQGRSGRLVLLDTPGPNEAGQSQLRRLLREQLSKSSAVLVVLDYTQMGSDADDDVRDELKKIAEVMAGRSYVLVNKFDQKDMHSDNEKQVRDLVTKDLLKDVVKGDDVFPVSARWAYLSNRARQAIRFEERLPDPEQEPWVSDFGSEAFGRRWRDRIESQGEISEGADTLWKDSLFTAPLERVIQSAYSRAAVLAVHSAAAKLSDYEQKISNYLSIRSESLRSDIDVLKSQITALEKDLKEVADSEKAADKKTKLLLSRIDRELGKRLKICTKEIEKEIDEYFERGKEIKAKNIRRRAKKKQKSFLGSLRSLLSTDTDTDELDFDPECTSIEFECKSEAEDLIRKMNSSITVIMKQSKIFLRDNITGILDELEIQLDLIRENDTTKIIRHLEERLGDADFQVSIQIPDSSNLELEHRIDGTLQDFFEEKTKRVTKRRRQSGIWGTICGWFGTDDWGWESYTKKETRYVVNFEDVRNRINGNMNDYFSGLAEEIRMNIEIPIKENIGAFFVELKLKIENLRGDFVQSIQDHGLEKKKKEHLHEVLISYQEKIPNVRRGCIELKKDVDEML